MATTLEDLDNRLRAVELEMMHLRHLFQGVAINESPEQRAIRLIRLAELSRPQLVEGWEKAMKELGIAGKPVGALKLQEMMVAAGIKPEGNEFSREIVA